MAIIGQGIINAGAMTGGVGSIDAATLQGHPASYFTPMSTTAVISGAVTNLQQQMSGVQNLTSRVVFKEAFTGNGVSNTFNLNGTVLNAAFATGAWGSGYIVLSLTAYITDLNGNVIYDSIIPIYRDKIQVTSVDSSGLVTTDFIPQAGQQGYIWYWYQLTTTDTLSYYYREDFVTYAESEAGTDVATAVYVGPTAFSNVVVKITDVTVDDALHSIDTYVAEMSAGAGFTPYAGIGIDITPVGNDYLFSVEDYISKTEVAGISGDLQDLIFSISIPTSATFLIDYDARYVNESEIGNYLSSYTLLSTTADISANFQAQINGKAPTAHLHTSNDITDFNEAVDDKVYGLLVAGPNIQISYNDPLNTLTIGTTFNASALLQGIQECDTDNDTYTISHPLVDPNYSNPTISLLVPMSGSNLFVQGITNVQDTSFQVVLSEVPNVSGYKIFWHLPSTSSSIVGTAVVNQQMTTLPSVTVEISGAYNITFTDTVVYASSVATIYLPASPSANEHHWIVNLDGGDIRVEGNGKSIWVGGVANSFGNIPADSSVHFHYNQTKDRWYII